MTNGTALLPDSMGVALQGYHPSAAPRGHAAASRFTARTLSHSAGAARALFFHQPQRGMSSLGLGCWRGEEDSGFEQKLAYLVPYKIADPGGGYIPCEQLHGMGPRPFSLFVGALTA